MGTMKKKSFSKEKLQSFHVNFKQQLHFSLVHSSCIGSPLELSPLCVHILLATFPLKFNDAPTRLLSLEKNSIFSVYLLFVKVKVPPPVPKNSFVSVLIATH